MCRANQRQKAGRSVTSMTLKILGQDPPEVNPPGDTVPLAALFWLSLLGVCCRPPPGEFVLSVVP